MTMCNSLSKLFIIIIAILFWIVASGLIYLSVWNFTEYGKLKHLSDFLNSSLLPAYILLAAGIVLFLLGLAGIIGAVKENKCIIALYFSLMLIAFIGLVAGIALAYVYRGKLNDGVRKMLHDGLEKYDNDTKVKEAIDDLQQSLHCCGVDNSTDWMKTNWHRETHHPYPDSCCVDEHCDYNGTLETYYNGTTKPSHTTVYKEGCFTELHDQVLGHVLAIFGVVAGAALFLLLGMIAACCLLYTRRLNEGFIYRDLGDTEGMHV